MVATVNFGRDQVIIPKGEAFFIGIGIVTVTTLDDKIGRNAMKKGVIKIALFYEVDKIGAVQGSVFIKFQINVTMCGKDTYFGFWVVLAIFG